MLTNKHVNKIFLSFAVGAFLLSSCGKPSDTSSPVDTSSDTSSEISSDTSDNISSDTSNNTASDTSNDTSSDTSSGTSNSSSSSDNHYDMPSEYAGYYSSLGSNPTSSQLKSIVSSHTKLSYDGARSAMVKTDRDWTLSPNNSDSNPYMRLIYAAYNFKTSSAARFNDNNTIWDREHIWAKSHGGFDDNTTPGSDLHHLRASDKPNNNSWRNSRNFGNATSGQYGKDYRGLNSGKYSGGSLDGIYEPLDHDKGDVARACFYMAVVYNTNCTLVNSYPGTGKTLGHLSTLLQWHELDPVDEFEMNRNNLIYDNYQHNRNPFIDHPEWVHSIF